MNDPQLDEPIESSAQEIEARLDDRSSTSSRSRSTPGSTTSGSSDAHGRDPEGYYQPKRWWFTSTAFPLIAGTFGPISNLFSVCALVQTWRVHFDPNVEGTEAKGKRVADPPWLIAVNVVSLVFALAANVLLSLNFAHRVRYRIAQPLTIVFWYISCFTLVGLIIPAHEHLILYPRQQHAFSQSFYYGIISAVLYFIISTLLLWNLLGAYYFKKYPSSFTTLTIPQRTLMLQTISYSCYLALGAGIFAGLEGWEFVDGIYFADYTLLTIGLGSDFPLSTKAARALLIPYSAIGIIMIGLIINSIRSLFLERGKAKVKRRALHKKRVKIEKIEKQEKRKRSWKEQFEVMRNIQEEAAKERKWWGFAWSFGAFLAVWLGGAAVFMVTERPQKWTYFQSLYFAYTSLLTVGYGDFYPQSNSGKPFFVIWSLIAVPTVTVLISSMGDTVVGWVKEGTLWLGQKTILPERESRGHHWQSPKTVKREVEEEEDREENAPDDNDEEAQEVEQGTVGNRSRSASSSTPIAAAQSQQPHIQHNREKDYPDPPRSTHSRSSSLHDHHESNKPRTDDSSLRTGLTRLGSTLESTERQRATEAAKRNDPQATSTHVLTACIAREIKQLAQDVGHTPPKKYEWENWKRWLEMLDDEDEESAEWRWLGDHGPLLSGISETEWVLGKLCERLEMLLEDGSEEVRNGRGRSGGKKDRIGDGERRERRVNQS